MANKTIGNLAPWFAMLAIILAVVNVLVNVFSMAFPLLEYGSALVAFFAIPIILYSKNEMKFKSMLDLTLFTVIVGVFSLILIAFLMYGSTLPVTLGIVLTIFNGFIPLMAGIVLGGVITVFIGFLNLPGSKKGKLF